MEPHGHLRVPREGADCAPSRRPAGLRGTLPRPGDRSGDSASAESLGVTAVELLARPPADRRPRTSSRAVSPNYWGYNTLGFFAPDVRYATAGAGEQVAEFKTMVKRLHRAGIEVILDVVYNHTAEGDHLGPTLSLPRHRQRRLLPPRSRRPAPLRRLHRLRQHAQHAAPARDRSSIMDSLRYWVEEMHVDGFRFDLAPALARERTTIDTRGDAFFDDDPPGPGAVAA